MPPLPEDSDDLREEATSLLRSAAAGDAAGTGRLLEVVYGELRRMAAAYLAQERAEHTLQPTALVHEAYMRLVDAQGIEFNDREHFFATAARAMRRILVDHARARGREKRGGEWNRVPLDAELGSGEDDSVDLIALDKALHELQELSERQARIVELRFFAGMEVEAVARILDISERTVAREWRFARAWLLKRLLKT